MFSDVSIGNINRLNQLVDEQGGKSMNARLEYEVTVADHIAKLESFVHGSAVGRNFTWFAYFAIVGLSWLSAILFYLKQGHQNYGYIFSGVVALALTISLPALYRWYQNAFWLSVLNPTSVQGYVGRKILEVNDDDIEETGEILTIRAHWRHVQRIDEDPQRISLVLAPLISFVIPLRAFENAAARDSFVAECKARLAVQRVTRGVSN